MINFNTRENKKKQFFLSLIPFIALIFIYVFASQMRHAKNPTDKLLPTISEVTQGFKQSAFISDTNGDLKLEIDTIASFKRIGFSMLFILFGVIIGLYMGAITFFDNLFYKFFLFFDKIPALAVLPILFITTGIGEVTKVTLIVVGVAPTIILDTYLRVKAVPQEQIIKAMTLNANRSEIIFRIILPKIFPNILDTIRLNFKAIILFLIAGESLAATVGLGYRIFLVQRYLAMNIIIPYVLWISLFAFLFDWFIRFWINNKFKWFNKEQ